MAGNELWVQNKFLQTYLKYVEHTESPITMHLWSVLTAASACLGRHVYLPFGIGDIYPNLYTLLVGPPGTRKSNAIKYCSKLVAKHTAVRFAPDDTGGQRQGLISAIEGGNQLDDDEQDYNIMNTAGNIANLTEIANITMAVNGVDSHAMFACASEFGTFMGEGNANLARLLIKTYDGEDYKYALKNTEMILKDPLMTIIGGTTTSDIARILPNESIGQGFMSRWILVFAPQKEKKVARPYLRTELANEIGAMFGWLSYEMRGEFKESDAAKKLLDNMYETVNIDLEDSRFLYYAERRHTHLQKMSMILAALRQSYQIEKDDVAQADTILSATEEYMPEALGEFGLSPIGAAKQKMLEFLQHAKEPISYKILWTVMQRDMRNTDFLTAIADLINSDKIVQIEANKTKSFVYKDSSFDALDLVEAGLL